MSARARAPWAGGIALRGSLPSSLALPRSGDDPLKPLRPLLESGVACKHYFAERANPDTRHAQISSDWDYFVVREPAKGNKLRKAVRTHLRKVRRAYPGYGVGHGHKKLIGKDLVYRAVEECSFYVELLDEQQLCFECRTEGSRDNFVDAFNKLVLVFNRAPAKLQPKDS